MKARAPAAFRRGAPEATGPKGPARGWCWGVRRGPVRAERPTEPGSKGLVDRASSIAASAGSRTMSSLARRDRRLLGEVAGGQVARPRCRQIWTSGGSSAAHLSCAFQQRVRKRQPDGGLIGEGTSPASRIRSSRASSSSGSASGTARQQRVGVRVPRPLRRSSRGRRPPRSCPRYITATRCEKCRTIARSWAMKRNAMPSSRCTLLQQVDHLRLDRHVQRRDRLVGHDQLRAPGPAPGPPRCAAAGRRRTRAGSGCSARG